MEPFGPFEAGREIESAGGSTVYRASKEGDSRGEYVVKIFSLEKLLTQEEHEAVSELDPLFKDIGGAFTSRINLEKKAGEGSPYFVPILAAGHDGRGAWYATNFYPRSVKGMLERLVALEAPDLFHIIESLVGAALHLKKTCGRSHGNFKPSNVFIDGTGRPRASRVVVSDPLPGEAKDSAVYELADLRAIGELLYQLVLRRKVDFSTGWVILPVETSREWTQLFHKRAPDWLALCNRLLDPRLSLEQYNLEKMESDLARLKPRAPVLLKVAPVAAVIVVVAAVAIYWMTQRSRLGTVLATTDPPGARLVVTPIVDGFEARERSQTNATPADGRPLKLTLEKGEYNLRANYRDLDQRRARVNVESGQTVTARVSLVYGQLVVVSEPPGARFRIGGREETTPYTNAYAKPEPVSFQLDYEANGEKYVSAQVQGTVASNRVTVLSGRLVPPKPGEEVVEFISDPPGAEVFIDGKLALKTSPDGPMRTKLIDGRYQVSVRLRGWASKDSSLTVNTKRGRTPLQSYYFEHGTVEVAAGDPAGLEVLVDGVKSAVTPAKIYLPPGRFDLVFRSDGYETNRASVTVADKGRYPFSPALKALAGFVELTSDPPGAEIRDLADKVLGVTGPDGSARIALAPGVYNLKATFGDLRPVEMRGVEVKAGQPRQVGQFNLDYGTVQITQVEPSDAQAAASIRQGDRRLVKIGEQIRQRPEGSVAYRIEAPGYQPWVTNVTVSPKQTRQVAVRLTRVRVPVRLASEPPGAQFYSDGRRLEPGGPEYTLPWGQTELVARYGRLGSFTNIFEVLLGATNIVPTFRFEFGTVVLTNLPDEVTVKVGDDELAVQPGPMRLAYDRPGVNTYDLYQGNLKVDSVTTNLPRGGSILLSSEVAAREFRNGIGLALVKIPNLFGPGKPGWVGKSEVTQAEYQRVMGAGADPSKFKGPDLPVGNVTWVQATEFCQKLTQLDTRHPPGPPGQYVLPTLEQWKAFQEGADLKNAVYGAAEPARVGSKGPSNKLGVNDVLGNVREWLSSADPRNKDFVGGGFRSRPSFGGMGVFLNPQQIQLDQASDDLGFRVIWVPAQ